MPPIPQFENLFVDNPLFECIDTGSVDQLGDTMHQIGRLLGEQTTELGLIGYGDPQPLNIHSETIYSQKMCRYFMLGCVQPATVGGESTIYDGPKAAELLIKEQPDLAAVTIEYRADPAGLVSATAPLISSHLPGETSLCFRQYYELDVVHNLPRGWTLESFHEYMDNLIERCIAYERALQPGEIILVDNFRTLHGRQPYQGERKMIRVRVDEPRLG